MDMYRSAYEYYTKMCEEFDMKQIPFYRFMHTLTEDQLQLYSEKAN